MMRTSLNAAYLLLVGTIVIGIAIIFSVLRPLLSEIADLNQKQRTMAESLAARQAFLFSLDRKQAALQTQAADERLLEVALPASQSLEDVTRLLHNAATVAGGTIITIDNNSQSEQRSQNNRAARGEQSTFPDTVIPLGFGVEFVGTYQQVRVFLEQLEKAPRLFELVALDMSRKPNQIDALVSKLQLRFYQQKIPST